MVTRRIKKLNDEILKVSHGLDGGYFYDEQLVKSRNTDIVIYNPIVQKMYFFYENP